MLNSCILKYYYKTKKARRILGKKKKKKKKESNSKNHPLQDPEEEHRKLSYLAEFKKAVDLCNRVGIIVRGQ